MALIDDMPRQGNFLFRHRSYLPLLLLAAGLAVVFWSESGQRAGDEPIASEWLEVLALPLSLAGLLIRIFVVGYSPPGTSGRNTRDGQQAAELNTTGAYSLVRHPLYLGNFLIWAGLALFTESLLFAGFFVLVFALYYERIMMAEERFLEARFGAAFREWSRRTPAFIPLLRRFSESVCYRKPDRSFCWRRVLRSEKNGLAALFSSFWLLDAAGEWAERGYPVLETGIWFYAACASLLVYLLLKLLKVRGHLKDCT